METCSERRKRKLIELASEKGGLRSVAADCGVNYASLDQVVKGVPLPPKADGSRSERSLGDDTARIIEKRYGLERGWFDTDIAPAVRQPRTLESALDVLSSALQEADKDALIAVERLLAAMAADPTTAKNKSELILKLLVTPSDKPVASDQDGMRQTHIYENFGVLDLGDQNGKGDSATSSSATSGGRK